MLKTKRILATAVALIAANFALPSARADVLESAPADALVAIRVANLTKTSAKVAQLAKDFGIDGFVPPLADPLGSLKNRAKITKGIKDDGELGFAILKPEEGQREPGMIMLVPVTSYDEFLSNFEDAKVEGGVAEIKLATDPEPAFAADWGEYVAISPTRNLVATKPASTLKPAGFVAKDGARQDFFLYANFSKLTPELLPELEKGFAEVNNELAKNLGKDVPEKWHPLIKTSVTQLFNVARTFLKDVDSASVGLNISDAGINTTVISEFKPDSYLGKMMASVKGTDASLTTGLPAGKYLVFGGAFADPVATAKVIDDLTKPIVEELNKIEGQEKAQTAAKSLLAAFKANKGYIFGMPTPTKIGQEGIFQQVAIYKGGGKEMKSAADASGAVVTDLFAEIKAQAKQKNPDAADDAMGSLTVTPAARTIEGVSFDTWKVEMPQAKDDPAAMQAEMMLGLFYGGEGLSYSMAQMDDNFIFAQSATDENIARFITAAKENKDNLSGLPHIKVVTAELPKTRVYEGFLALDEFFTPGAGVAGTFGMQIPVQLPPDLAPIGFSAGTEGTSLRIDTHVPRKTVQDIISAVMQVMQQMQGGGGGGNL